MLSYGVCLRNRICRIRVPGGTHDAFSFVSLLCFYCLYSLRLFLLRVRSMEEDQRSRAERKPLEPRRPQRVALGLGLCASQSCCGRCIDAVIRRLSSEQNMQDSSPWRDSKINSFFFLVFLALYSWLTKHLSVLFSVLRSRRRLFCSRTRACEGF